MKQVEDLTHKLKSETDTVTKLRKSQQELKKVVYFSYFFTHLFLCKFQL